MRYAKKWMVVPFQENNQDKIENKIDKLDKIIRDETIDDDDKLGLYSTQFKKIINQEPINLNKSENISELKDKMEKIELERMKDLNSMKKLEEERYKEMTSIQNTINDILENRQFGNNESFYRQPFASTRMSQKRRRLDAINNAPKISNRVISRVNNPEIITDSNKTTIKSANNVFNWSHHLNNLSNSFNKFNLNDVSMLE